MDLPGSSLFNGGSLHFDGLAMEPGAAAGAEEEAEAAEEEERRNQELQNVLKDAFDDLIDDDDESTMDHTGDPSFHPEKYPTSTPFIAGKERSLYDELGGRYDLPRMSDPGAGYNPDSDGYHGNPAGDYRHEPAGDYHGDSAGGYHGDSAGGYHGDPAGGYHAHHAHGGHSEGEYSARRDADDPSEFLTMHPEETNAGLTEIVNTPRQHLDTSATDSSAAHYRHCYTSPRNDLAAAAAAAAAGDDAGSGDADGSSGHMIEMGLRAHQEHTGDWPATGRPPEPAADVLDVLNPGKYVANKQKDYILARTSRDQLETLYEARGHEIGRLRAQLEQLRTEEAAELRACRHQATLATADGQGLQTSLQQARLILVDKEDQLTKLNGEVGALQIQLQTSEEVKKECTSRLQAAEVTVQSLQSELTDLRRSEALARNTERHQQLVDGLQRRHQAELADRQQQLDVLQAQLAGQTEQAATLRSQLTDSEQTRHRLAADKGDVINQLTAGLEAAQARCRQLMQGEPALLRERLAQEEEQRKQLQLQLSAAQDQLTSVQRDLDACESVLRLGGGEDAPNTPDNGNLGMSAAPQSSPVTRPTGGQSAPFSLRRELMRAMENTRSRREEVGRLRAELDQARDHLRTTAAQLTERDAQLAATRHQATQQPPPAADQQQRRRLDELQLQVATEQNQRRLLEDQLRKIKAEGQKVHKTAEELRRHMSEQLEQADRDKLEAVDEVRAACLQLHDDMMDKLRTEKVEEYETEFDALRSELTQAQQELNEVKELYVKVCQEKDKMEQETETARKAAPREQELAVKAALDRQYDVWYADWLRSQQAAVTDAVEAERRRHVSEVASAGTQTERPPSPAAVARAAHSTQTAPPSPPPPSPQTRDGAVQADDQQAAEQLDKLKKRLKRACLEKKRLETEAKELLEQMKTAAHEHEQSSKKERQEADRKVRDARRRSSGSADSELVKTLRHELEATTARLRKLTEQTCIEKDELIRTYESRLMEAMEQDRRMAAALVTSQRRQLTGGQLTAECDRLRSDLEALRAEHDSQLRQSEEKYQQGLASYRQLIETNVAELTKAEEELRREAAASGQVLKDENERLTAEGVTLAESYDALLAQRQQDREKFEQQVRQLTAESAGGDRELHGRVAELQSRLQQADAETDQLRDKLRLSKEKLRNYHGYVKEREQHYDAEFRRLEAEYRVAVGKMKEKVMLAREVVARRPPRASAATQTEVSGEELVQVLQDMSGFQRTVGEVRLQLTQAVLQCGQPRPPPPSAAAAAPPAAPPPELSTYRSHTLDRRLPPLADRPSREPLSAVSEPRDPGWPDYGALSSLGRLDSGRGGGSPLLAAADNPLASLERIRRDLNYIFPRESTAGGGQRSSAEEVLARLSRLPLTPPSRDGNRLN